MNEKKRKTALILMIIFLWVTLLFGYSIQAREPWFGVYQSGEHQWLTGSTIKFTKNWIAEDPVSIKFALLENPPSIEFPTLESRGIYASYPPGTVIPIFILVKILDNVSFPEVVMTYNLLNHYLIGLIISVIIFLYVSSLDLEPLPSLLFAFIPPVILFLLPGPLYWFQNIYWADQAVIFPFVVFVSLEILLDVIARNNLKSNPDPIVKYKSQIMVFQGIVGFIGIFTDWLFLFVYAVIFVKRIFLHEFYKNQKISLLNIGLFFLPVVIGMGLFILQIITLGQVNYFFETVGYRTSIDTAGRSVINNFPDQMSIHFNHSFGNLGAVLVILSLVTFVMVFLIVVMFKKFHQNTDPRILSLLSVISIIILPCIFQVVVGSNHSFIHSFSVLKFSFALSTIPFIFFPLSLLIFSEKMVVNKKWFSAVKIFIPIVLIISVVFYVSTVQQLSIFGTVDDYSAEQFINGNTYYSDIIFSPHYRIDSNPPQKLSYSMKRVYFIEDLDDIRRYLSRWNISGELFTIGIFLKRDTLNEFLNQTLSDAADAKYSSEKYILYKFEKENQFFKSINFTTYFMNWYYPEDWNNNGVYTRWMNKESFIVIELFETDRADVSFDLVSFYRPRLIRIDAINYPSNEAIGGTDFSRLENAYYSSEEQVGTGFSRYEFSIQNRTSIIRFQTLDEPERPIDIPDLQNIDDRYLSIAIRNVSVHT